MTYLQAIILAIVEGLTEFLPVSSTGHMILTQAVLKMHSSDFLKFFTVEVQLGAILAVVVTYFKRFLKSFDFYFKLIVAVIPALIFGVLLGDKIDSVFENPIGVAIALLIGGILLLFIDKIFNNQTIEDSDKINMKSAFIIGLFQSIALFPGVSRSAASIIGGLTQKLKMKAAAEFSFFLAVPTMFAATAKKSYDFYKSGIHITSSDINTLLVGNVVAFVVAILAIKFFISFLTNHGFKLFGYYRIALGGIIILLYLLGYKLEII